MITNGEELGLVLEVANNLKEIGIDTKVYSVPCMKNIKREVKTLKSKTTYSPKLILSF